MDSSKKEDHAFEADERKRIEGWRSARDYGDADKLVAARAILLDLAGGEELRKTLHRHPAKGAYLSKDFLVYTYRKMVADGELQEDPALLAQLRRKPVRTLSGVATVAVLTKTHPCPGECLFCPNDDRMPKSYIADEPGALRAGQHEFDPYAQVASRIDSLQAVGHPVEKIELLILGGTWTSYPSDYRETFIRRCLDAINGSLSSTLEEAQRKNETSARRNVGMVLETRPDEITPESLRELRRLGATKIQIGLQSLNDDILRRNCRGHSVEDSRRGVRLLRAAGFKIHAHWMPNLLGATPQSDYEDFLRLWEDPDLRPDELKIYPVVLVRNSGLFAKFEAGEYKPYELKELLDLLIRIKPEIPRYCRVNRLARDIPAHHVAAGITRSNIREDAQRILAERGLRCQCIRCREIRSRKVRREDLTTEEIRYEAGGGEERFFSFVTNDDRLAGYLRLFLPGRGSPDLGWKDLEGAAIIREVHIYGLSVRLKSLEEGAAQHQGLGSELIIRAEKAAREAGYRRLAVISAVGTRTYYGERGFVEGELYPVKEL